MEMEMVEVSTTSSSSAVVVVVVLLVIISVTWWFYRVVNWVWLRPKRLEKCLRKQGLRGNPYRLLYGDLKDSSIMISQARSKPINLSDDVVPRILPFPHHTINNYGKDSFMWIGPIPRVNITNPEYLKDIFMKIGDFPKPHSNRLFQFLARGLADYDGHKWAKHRKIINPAFHVEKLKDMVPAFYLSCSEMLKKWGQLMDGSAKECCEVDVWPYLENLTGDVISRTAFGSSYEEARSLFQLQKEQAQLVVKAMQSVYVPGWRFVPTKMNKRMKQIDSQVRTVLKDLINKREIAMKAGEAPNDDLLGILMESNLKEIQAHGNNNNVGLSIRDVIEECKLFYFAGQETTSVLLVWTMVMLSRFPHWQARARDEVLQVFGDNTTPDYDGLARLKVVTMIFYEVLRLYPPVVLLVRTVDKQTQLGNLSRPAGVQVSLPTILVHHDTELWGEDAKEFKPERFAEGVSKATKGQVSFLPFGWGPRICIGQNFALAEAKMAMALILQRFTFELSPSYAHAPATVVTLQPQYGAHLILHKLT
ncbi:cytochrome P450 CYP72A219-like isoform X2 [Humulus lupulus]|uniref:cytochrome P450 CYP72A219-like isoform X2 n=1 Tax=Humulus lupulus TaxID=3486 RepID=UPI002B40FC7C|nr:cytochrome P450 CYP72A219-like isoform X2 [Humulus lupulus]